jgi:hypothetical protein
MKFRVVVSILTIAILGLFITVIVQSANLVASKNKTEALNKDLKISQLKLQNSKDSISIMYDTLESVMKRLDVWDDSAQKEREKQLKNRKYKLGIEVQANKADYQSLVAYTVGSGFQISYINKRSGQISSTNSVIYYYSPEGKLIAEELKHDLAEKFPDKLAKIKEVKQGGNRNTPGNVITAKLGFRY